jgi:hypothetical protein
MRLSHQIVVGFGQCQRSAGEFVSQGNVPLNEADREQSDQVLQQHPRPPQALSEEG